jgi:fumarate reductase flavoprotein subunit
MLPKTADVGGGEMSEVTPREYFDVVVVGGGAAGLAAAIEARTLGRDVLLLEKNPQLGGSTAWSIGSISASATPHQIRKGIKDSPQEHWADMPLFAGDLQPRDNDELRRILCESMPETFRWLLSLGVRFYGPMPEPPHRKPRMHNVLPNSKAYIYHLERHARRLGVDIRTDMRAAHLLVEDERVVGVECESAAGTRRFLAAGGTILATGDFTASAAFKHQYMGPRAARVEAVNATATGDGQALALKLGATVINGDLALGPEIRFVAPARQTLVRRMPPWRALAIFIEWSMDHLPQRLLRPFVMSFLTTALAPSLVLFEQGAILVNKDGERFCDELDQPALAIPEQPDKTAYILIDQRLASRFSAWPYFVSTAPGVAYAYVPDYRRNRPDVFHRAPSLEALAGKLGMQADRLARAILDHNRALGEAAATRGQGVLGRAPLSEPPYVALGPVRSVFVHSEGGLAVDLEHRVLGADGAPIAGLYAAGSTGQGGLLLKGHGHHISWAFSSGRRAGRIAALKVTSSDIVA